MTFKNHLFYFFFCWFILNNCTAQKTAIFSNRLVRDTATVQLNPNGKNHISFYYSGCAGFFIRKGNDAVLNDPFFSNKGPLLLLPFKSLATDTAEVEHYFNQILKKPTDNEGIIKALLATHTHYDHVLDIPHIYHSKLNNPYIFYRIF